MDWLKPLPLILSNISPVIIAQLLPRLNKPVDFGKKINGKRLFGNHKTWRGVASMIMVALVTAHYLRTGYGLLIGLGVVLGDLLTSYLKRRAGLKPGDSFQPYDSLLLILSVLAVTPGLYTLTESVLMVIGAPIVYKGFNTLGFIIGLQEKPY